MVTLTMWFCVCQLMHQLSPLHPTPIPYMLCVTRHCVVRDCCRSYCCAEVLATYKFNWGSLFMEGSLDQLYKVFILDADGILKYLGY